MSRERMGTSCQLGVTSFRHLISISADVCCAVACYSESQDGWSGDLCRWHERRPHVPFSLPFLSQAFGRGRGDGGDGEGKTHSA